jgi:hypothetical protein
LNSYLNPFRMKKIFFCALLIVSQTAFAQWQIGGTAGLTLSNYKSKTPWKEVSNTGFAIGVSAYKQFNADWSVQLQLTYIQKGYFHKICNTIYDKLEANYIEMPVMADYSFLLPMKNFKGHANLGFYTAYWLGAKYKTKGFDDTAETFDFKKNNASRFDVGPLAGFRVEYMLNNGSVSLDIRYEIGLLDLQKSESDNTKNSNRAMIIGLSYIRPFGR